VLSTPTSGVASLAIRSLIRYQKKIARIKTSDPEEIMMDHAAMNCHHRSAAITDIPGLRIGHAHDSTGITGCSVILAEDGAVAGMDKGGSASGSRETDPLELLHVVGRIQGLLLCGGSAFGLGAASGVMRYLDERGRGFPVGVTRVPIVPSAVIFDLKIGQRCWPDEAMAYQACLNASDQQVDSGCVGAGIGATAGKYAGMEWAMKSGLGQAGLRTESGVVVAALAVVNPFGDIVDPASGRILCGCRAHHGNSQGLLGYERLMSGSKAIRTADFSNTILGVVATNVKLDKLFSTKLAQMAQDGLARVVRPAHTLFDGDIVFALSMGDREADFTWLGLKAADMLAESILQAARTATPLGGFSAMPRDDQTEPTGQVP
jgi:L-aminopeptidase/D-esterase-like protein